MRKTLSVIGVGVALVISGCGNEDPDQLFFGGFSGLIPNAMRFSAQPTTGTPNVVLNNLQVQFVNGNQVVPVQAPITLTLSTNPTGAVLGGTTQGNSNNGTADFNNLTINKKGVYRITAAGPGVASIATNPIVIGGGAVNLANPTQIANPGIVAGSLLAVHSGDLNNDGNLDLVTTIFDDRLLAVYLGNGAGGFGAPTNRSTGNGPQDFTLVDFDADGRLDVAVPINTANQVALYRGLGDGTFAPDPPLNVNVGTNPVAVRTADFNGDGRADLAVSNSNGATITILLNNGNSTFTASTLNMAVGTDAPTGLVALDINGDGRADLATADFTNDKMEFFINNGNGTFGAAQSLAAGVTPRDIATGDFNGDGRADLVTANRDSNNLSVFINNGGGSFNAATSLAAGTNPNKVAVADLNLDGRLDILTTNSNSSNASLFLGNGDGTFAAGVLVATTSNTPVGLDVADYNKDSVPDFSVGNFVSAVLNIYLQIP